MNVQPPPASSAPGASARAAPSESPGAAGTAASVPALAAPPAAAAGSGGMASPEAGAGGAPTLQISGDLHDFSFGRRSFVVDAAHGARVTHFGLDANNLLTGPDVDMLNYGATLWPSPQERWGWPPVPELDSEAYQFMPDAEGGAFESRSGVRARVRVGKRIRSTTREDSVAVTYSLRNEDSAAASWAAWEITRVPAGGLSFFPTGERKVNTQLSVLERGAITWFQHDPMKISGEGQKFTADGAEGWLAHVVGRTLLVKKFEDVPADAQAPAPEAEIALYAAQGYVEIEPQGPYTMLMPGEALTWTVRWIVAELPAQLPAELGNEALVELVRSLVASSP